MSLSPPSCYSYRTIKIERVERKPMDVISVVNTSLKCLAFKATTEQDEKHPHNQV